VMEYTAGGDVVKELERTLKIADEVLRFVSVRAAEVKRKERPSRSKKALRSARPAAEAAAAVE